MHRSQLLPLPRPLLSKPAVEKYLARLYRKPVYIAMVTICMSLKSCDHACLLSGETGPSEEAGEVSQEIVEVKPGGQGSAAEAMDVDQSSSSNPPVTTEEATPSSESHDPAEPEPEWVGTLKTVDNILRGERTVSLHQEFLIRNNHTDLQILKNTKVCRLWLPWQQGEF